MVSAAGWETFPLTQLIAEVEKTRDDGKYLIIHDKNGNVPTFFRYKGYELSLHSEIVKAALGRCTIDDCVEKVRSAFVCCMRTGENMLIDCGQGGCNFKDKHCNKAIIDFDIHFDFVEGRKHDNVIKIVKESENHSVGGLNPGHYMMQPKFSASFCCSGDDAACAEWVANIPHSDKMRKIIIT